MLATYSFKNIILNVKSTHVKTPAGQADRQITNSRIDKKHLVVILSVFKRNSNNMVQIKIRNAPVRGRVRLAPVPGTEFVFQGIKGKVALNCTSIK